MRCLEKVKVFISPFNVKNVKIVHLATLNFD